MYYLTVSRYHPDKHFSCVKTMKNGDILVQEAKSNDIVELAPNLKELKRLKGVPGLMLQNDSIRNCRHSHDDSILPWVKGTNLISLITIKDLSMKEVKNFFGQEEETDIIPIMSICNSEGEKLFGTAISKGKMRLSFWEKSTSPRYFNLSELYPNSKLQSPSRYYFNGRNQSRRHGSLHWRVDYIRSVQGQGHHPSRKPQQEIVLHHRYRP